MVMLTVQIVVGRGGTPPNLLSMRPIWVFHVGTLKEAKVKVGCGGRGAVSRAAIKENPSPVNDGNSMGDAVSSHVKYDKGCHINVKRGGDGKALWCRCENKG